MVKLFTDSDLDGLGCGILAKLAYGENADVSYCSYRNLNQRVEAFIENQEQQVEQMFITDLAVNGAIEQKLAQRFNAGHPVRVIDHHVTALHFNDYEWGSIKVEYDSGKKTCATSLFYDYLVDQKVLNTTPSLDQFVDLVRQYDTWEWDENNNITAKRLNDLFYIMDRETFEAELIKRISVNPDSFTLTDTETMILEIEENKISRYIQSKNRQMVQAFVEEYCCGIVHAEQYLSELGNALNKLNPHLDMIVLLNAGNKKIGFRTIHNEVNVAEFAKRFGGGGHPKASGCELSSDTFSKFVVNVFDIPALKPDPTRNELNLKSAEYGTVYQNRKKEFYYIQPQESAMYAVIQNGKKIEHNFEGFEQAERFIKRNFSASLCFDDECLKLIAGTLSIQLEEAKANYKPLLRDTFEKIREN
ncbi:MAG: DHHA1 domain-containing protein [Bacillota bacterium]|nr:DHHA1 domain-containing protein [Bacillota bacterium]